MSDAPFYRDVAYASEEVEARWLTAADGVRLRAATWAGGDSGTVLIFSGRTEYVEKYSRVAAYLRDGGLSVASVDWRGQGLSDRALPDVQTGHVTEFSDYQLDVAALHEHALDRGLPQPFHLLAHSMGGCIGLRALHRGLPVETVAFSAPMWGIQMSPMTRPIAWSVSWIGRALGRGDRYTPGTSAAAYVSETAFDTNLLTTDRDTFDWMQKQTHAHPDLALGGPSLSWLFAALHEMRSLRALAPPAYPALTYLGTEEAIIDPTAIRQIMRRWRGARLDLVDEARHELMMERPQVRDRFLDAAVAHFSCSGECCAA